MEATTLNMEQTRRSLEEKTIEEIATILSYCNKFTKSSTQALTQSNGENGKAARNPTQQELTEVLYQSCIALEKDNQYLYVLLARAEHKLRWHEDRERRQGLEMSILTKALSMANITLSRLTGITAAIHKSRALEAG